MSHYIPNIETVYMFPKDKIKRMLYAFLLLLHIK